MSKTFLNILKASSLGYLLLLMTSVSAQNIVAKLETKTPLKAAKFVGIDKYGSIYTIRKNTLYKKTDKKIFSFSSLQLGALTSVDILNPLKIVLFYKGMNTVVLVDDKLSEITRIDFNTYPYFRTLGFVTASNRDNLWIFNVDSQELELFDYKTKKTIAHTQPVGGEALQQDSNFNYCWLLTDTKLKRYNAYGSFMEEYPAGNILKIKFDNKYVLTFDNHQFALLDPGNHQLYSIFIPQIAVKDFYLMGKNLYIYDGKILYHYQLNLPN